MCAQDSGDWSVTAYDGLAAEYVAAIRSDVTSIPVPFSKIIAEACPDPRLRKLAINMVYVGVLAEFLGITEEAIELAMEQLVEEEGLDFVVAEERIAGDVGGHPDEPVRVGEVGELAREHAAAAHRLLARAFALPEAADIPVEQEGELRVLADDGLRHALQLRRFEELALECVF
jgi:hypothetical protein